MCAPPALAATAAKLNRSPCGHPDLNDHLFATRQAVRVFVQESGRVAAAVPRCELALARLCEAVPDICLATPGLTQYTGPVERKCGADYARTNGGEGDEDDESSDGEGVGTGATAGPSADAAISSATVQADVKSANGGAGKKTGGTAQSVHSNLRGKEEWKEASRGGYLGARGGGSGWNTSGTGTNGGSHVGGPRPKAGEGADSKHHCSPQKRLRDEDDPDPRRHPRISSPDARNRAFDSRHRSSHSDRSDDEMDPSRRRHVRVSFAGVEYGLPSLTQLYHLSRPTLPFHLLDTRRRQCSPP